MKVTNHARHRLQRRMNVPDHKALDIAYLAYKTGQKASSSQSEYWQKKQAQDKDVLYIIFRGYLFIYGLCEASGQPTLVTLYKLYRKRRR